MAATNKARWMKKLTKAEINHLREMGVVSLRKARETFEWQAAQRRENEKKHPDNHAVLEPCWDCKNIARKLGLPV